MKKYLLVLTTVPTEQAGEEIARQLVENRLAACVTVSSASRSFYRWEGKIAQDHEHILLIKTRTDLFSRLEAKLKELHPYSVPEIIALPIVAGSDAYLSWVGKETEG